MNGKRERDLTYENKIQGIITKCGNSSILLNYNKYMSSSKEKNTIYNYMVYIELFFKYIVEEKNISYIDISILNSIYPFEINDFIDKRFRRAEQEYSTEHAAICWSALNSFYKFLIANYKKEMTNGNPVADTERPKVKSKARETYLKPREIKNFLYAVKHGEKYRGGRFDSKRFCLGARDYLMCQLFIQFGLRASTVVGINIEDFDIENKILTTHEKGNNEYTYELTDEIIKSFNEWDSYRYELVNYKSIDALFVSVLKKRITYDSVNDIVNWYGKYIGKPELTPHGLRHTFGTNLYNMTKDIRLVQEEMHHSKITTTERYITVSKDKKKEARAKMAALVNG